MTSMTKGDRHRSRTNRTRRGRSSMCVCARVGRRRRLASRRRLLPRTAGLPAVLVSAATLGLALIAPPAQASHLFPKLGEITGPAPATSFGHLDPESVAVDDANNHIYVADSSNGLVYDFASASDTSPTILSGAETPSHSFGGGAVSVAVDAESGDLYVSDVNDLVVDKFDTSGKLISSFGDSTTPNGQLAGSGTPAGSFSHPTSTPLGIAVDQATHDLYVIDSGHQVIDIFDANGIYQSQISAVPIGLYSCGGELTDGIAVNAASGHVFVSDACAAAVFEFDSLGLAVETWTGAGAPNAFEGYLSVAVNDTTGDFFVTNTFPEPVVDEFSSTGAYIAQVVGAPGGPDGGVAVDQPTGELYVSDNASGSVKIFAGTALTLPTVTTGTATEIQPRSATLTGIVAPEGLAVTECRFDYVEAALYAPNANNPYSAGGMVPCTPSALEIPADSEEHAVHAEASGLRPGVTYHFRLQASNVNGAEVGQDGQFETLPPPAIESATASSVTANSADLNATINPRGLDTTYQFEYGTSTAYGTSVPSSPEDIGAGTRGVQRTQHITGLRPSTTYHWRVIATSDAGTAGTGIDHTFIYDESGSGGLPDNRAYEMVTPPRKNGALIGDVKFGIPPLVAEDGSGVILGVVQCFGDAISCEANEPSGNGSPYSFHRGAESWFASSLAPSAAAFEGSFAWLSFDPNTDSALYAIQLPNGVYHWYARGADGIFRDIGPLTPGPVGDSVTENNLNSERAGTASLSHVIYTNSNEPLWPFDTTQKTAANTSAYEYSGLEHNAPALVGVRGTLGSEELISECSTELGGSVSELPFGELSADGRTVYFTAGGHSTPDCPSNVTAPPVAELFARIDNGEVGARTVAISQPTPAEDPGCTTSACLANLGNGHEVQFRDAQFAGASSDGSVVFFTDTQQLTNEASEAPSTVSAHAGCSKPTTSTGCNLYVYSAPQENPLAGAHLTDVSAGDTSGGGPRVKGVVSFAPDGSHVSFVAQGVLPTAANGEGQRPKSGADNLYVWERDSAQPKGHLEFVSTLPETDSSEWLTPDHPANTTPDGRFLVFTSSGALTPDVTRTDGAQQVFRYDSATETLVLVSIGEHGFNDNGNEGLGNASIVPGYVGYSSLGAGRADPTMSHDGQYIFFMSPLALRPGALNDIRVGTDTVMGGPAYAENVYEYHDGHVYLISDGRDTANANSNVCEDDFAAVCLLGTDATGSNVFFTTVDPLLPQDTDTQLDVYDARICTSADPCLKASPSSPPPCLGEACHGTPAATPSTPGVPSATFNGQGNLTPRAKTAAEARADKLAHALKACLAKRNRHKRAACRRKARRRYGRVRHRAKSSGRARSADTPRTATP
jgi:DNA-binding beta-propeller fold protein YncE